MGIMWRSDDPVNPHRMKMAREVRGLTIQEVSVKSGIPEDDIARYESEGGVLELSRLRILARGYGFPPSFFSLSGEGYGAQFICARHDHFDEFLSPVQVLLDELVGESEIAELEWTDYGIHICWYNDDDDREPYYAEKIGNTIKQVETALRKRLRQNQKQGAPSSE